MSGGILYLRDDSSLPIYFSCRYEYTSSYCLPTVCDSATVDCAVGWAALVVHFIKCQRLRVRCKKETKLVDS